VSSPFLGQIIPVAFNFAPRSWAFCAGQFLPIAQNQALFSLLGTTYGGNGVTTFQLPNLQGRVAMHVGNGHTLGEAGGTESVAVTVNEIPPHVHQVTPLASKNEETTNRPGGSYHTVGGAYGSSPAGPAMGSTSTSAAGGGQPHSNLQPSLALSFVIALTGIFPSRS
jgi:microcystin-dependent protein